jgi:predicted permease
MRLDATSILVATAATAVVALLPGLLAALRLVRTTSAHGSVRAVRSISDDVRGVRHRRLLIAGEAALATVLLVGATLLIRSFDALGRVDPGFEEEGAIAMTVSIPVQKYSDVSETRRVYREILTGLRRLPGVVAAGAVTDLPVRSDGEGYGVMVPGINEPESPENWPTARRIAISDGAMEALGVTLVRGRHFAAADGPEDAPVALVNEAMVREIFLGQDPIGRFVSPGEDPREVVGVVRDVRQSGPGQDAPPAFYVPLDQEGQRPGLSFIVRGGGQTVALVTAMRDVVNSVDTQIPVADFVELDRLTSEVTMRPRFLAAIMSGFASLATMLAVLGVYAVLAHSVRARSREIGLRSALGASSREIVREVLTEGLRPTLAGLLVGLTAAAVLSGFLESLLFQVEPLDATSFAAGALMLVTASVAACVAPAVWAARLDPAAALKTTTE